MLRAVGFTDEDFGKPQVGVASSWNEVTPCNFGLGKLAALAKEGVRSAGAVPIEFTTIAVSDGIAMGHEGMKASLVSRETIADSVELVMHAERMDGLVGIAGCDKSEPGMLMAMARLDLPAVYLYGGTILPGTYQGRDVTIQDVFEAVGAHAQGTMSDEELDAITEQYTSEQPRGAEPRFWEDVADNEALPVMLKGPMTVTGFIAYAQGWGGLYIRANKLNHNVIATPHDRIGLIASGKAWNDTRQALHDLGLDDCWNPTTGSLGACTMKATGTTMSALTSSTPTTRIDTTTVSAVSVARMIHWVSEILRRRPSISAARQSAGLGLDPREERGVGRGEARDALQHGIDHVGAGGGEAIRVRQFVDLHDMLQHETLVGDGGGKGHHSLPRISTI